MPKRVTIAIVVGAIIIIGGGTALAVNLLNPNDSADNASIKLVDPEGTYDFFSDPSVTTYPEKNAVFGNGQSLAFEYDGGKTDKDLNAALSYQLYYIGDDGKVQPLGGGNLNGVGTGQFTTSTKIFNSAVSGASGFFELQGTYSSSVDENNEIETKTVTLGMYPIKFEIAE